MGIMARRRSKAVKAKKAKAAAQVAQKPQETAAEPPKKSGRGKKDGSH